MAFLMISKVSLMTERVIIRPMNFPFVDCMYIFCLFIFLGVFVLESKQNDSIYAVCLCATCFVHRSHARVNVFIRQEVYNYKKTYQYYAYYSNAITYKSDDGHLSVRYYELFRYVVQILLMFFASFILVSKF